MKSQVFAALIISIVLTSALFINVGNAASQGSTTIQASGTINHQTDPQTDTPALTVILRNIGVLGGSVSSINAQVDSFVASHPYATAITISDMHQYGIWWYGYSFSKTNGTWMGVTFTQLKTMIDRFHYYGWKVGLETTGIAWNNQQEYNYITTQHPELAFTDANALRATGIDNSTALTKNPGTNKVIPDFFAKFATADPINNIPAGTRLIDLYTARLTQLITDGLQWDFWFGTDGWNGISNQGYYWNSGTAGKSYSFSAQEESEFGNWTGAVLPSTWASMDQTQRASSIIGNSTFLNNWWYYWQIRFAQMYAQIKQAFIDAGESPGTFHLIGTADESSEPGGAGNLGPVGMYNMSLMAQYNSLDYFYVDQESAVKVGAINSLGREQAYVGALVKMQNPNLNPVIGLQPVDCRGNIYPLWEVEQEYMSQAINYVWYNGIRYQVSAPNVIMMQYPNATGWAGWTQQELTELFSFIGNMTNSLANAHPVWLGPTYTIPSNYSPMAWWGLNYSIAQWAWTANLANNPQYITQEMGTVLMDQTVYWKGPQLTGLYDKMVNQLWGSGKLNLWYYEDVPNTGISAIWGANEQQAMIAFHLSSSSGNATSFSVLSGLTDPNAKWIASEYEGTSYLLPSGYKGTYSAGPSFTAIASSASNGSDAVAAGYYKNSTTSNFLLTNVPSGSGDNTILLPRDMLNKMLYWVSDCPVNSSQALIDLKILQDGSGTIIIPMTNQRDVGNAAGLHSGWSITTTLSVNASLLGLSSPSNYRIYWASSRTPISVESWSSFSVKLNGMADSLLIVPV